MFIFDKIIFVFNDIEHVDIIIKIDFWIYVLVEIDEKRKKLIN